MAPRRNRLADRDVGHPAGPQDGQDDEADRAAPGDQDAVIGPHVGQLDGMEGDRRRLGQRRRPHGERVRDAQRVGRGHRQVLGEGAPHVADVARLAAKADRGPAPPAGPAPPHPGVGLKTTRSPPDHPGPVPSADATMPDHS